MTTPISELPTNNISMNFSDQSNEIKESTTNYTPLNIHPNPYGISDKNPILPNPEIQPPTDKPNMNQEDYANIPHQPMLSRDIPAETHTFQQDPAITPNYIPPSTKEDFLKDYHVYEQEILEQEKKDNQLDTFDYIMKQIQIPILISVLFYIFSNTKYTTLLLLPLPYSFKYNSDGNLNTNAYLVLSLIFGFTYYILDLLINYIGSV